MMRCDDARRTCASKALSVHSSSPSGSAARAPRVSARALRFISTKERRSRMDSGPRDRGSIPEPRTPCETACQWDPVKALFIGPFIEHAIRGWWRRHRAGAAEKCAVGEELRRIAGGEGGSAVSAARKEWLGEHGDGEST